MKKLLTAFLVVLMLAGVYSPVMAEDEEVSESTLVQEQEGNLLTVSYHVNFMQTEARKELDMVNAFRTGLDAWYWNSSNTEKIYCEDLEPFEYDYELEKIAMQRCAELLLRYDHTRPNGNGPFSAYEDYEWYGVGENIAFGFGMVKNAKSAFELWREDDQKYSGQGHRRNMLSSGFNRVGFAAVRVGEMYFWAQEFARSDMENSYTAPNDERCVVDVDVYGGDLNFKVAFSKKELTVGTGEAIDRPSFDLSAIHKYNQLKTEVPILNRVYTEIEDEDIATIEDHKIVGVSTGTTYYTLTLEGYGEIGRLKVNVVGGTKPITYHGLEGLSVKNPERYQEGNTYALAIPSKAGYEFAGYYLDSEYQNQITGITADLRGPLDIYAKWNPIAYSIQYDLAGGYLDGTNPLSYTVEDELVLLEPVKDDLIFAGWFDQNGKLFTGVDVKNPKDLILTAKYRYDKFYSIIYDLAGGINSIDNPDYFDEGGFVFTLGKPTKTGYTFLGWFDNPAYLGKAVSKLNIPLVEGEFVLLHAKWKENSYKLAYNKNSGSLLKGVKLPSLKYLSTDDNLVSDVEPYRIGYHFEGWSRDKVLNESSVIYKAGDNIKGINGNLKDKATVTLYAAWSLVDYQLSLDYDGGSVLKGEYVGDGIVHVIDKIKLPVLTKDNYKFKGFYNDLGKKVTTVSKTSKDTHLSALFVPISYRVSYVLNGGRISSSKGTYSTSVNIEGSLVLPEVNRDGYGFDGWYLGYDKTTGEYFNPVVGLEDLLPLTGSIKLYAKWN